MALDVDNVGENLRFIAALKEAREGSRIWLGNGREPKARLLTVTHVTAAQIVAGADTKFHKKNGYMVGGQLCTHDRLTCFATPAECEEWDVKQARRAETQQARQREQDIHSAKLAELRELFSPDVTTNRVYVRDAEWAKGSGEFDLTFHNLTENQVRELAAKLAASAPERTQE